MSLVSLAPLANAAKNKLDAANLEGALQRPLIMGASISADWSTSSPSKRLALRYTKASEIRMHAFGGRPGRDVLASLPAGILKDRSAVLSMDLFFWDSALADFRASVRALGELMSEVKKRDLPIVLGEIPELLPGRQPQRAKLNQALRDACAEYSKCFLMPFIDLHQRVMRDRHLEINKRRYTFDQLVPDGLHLSPTASEYIADLMHDTILGR